MVPRPDAMPLTGRERELAAVTAAVRSSAVAGVLLAGAAGVGKTRLAQEAADSAQADGQRVLTIRPPAGSRQLPLASLISLLPSGAGPSAPTDAGSHPVQTGLGLVERGLHGLISSGPTLLMVDDAHLLDEVSATVIHQLVVERSVRLLATLRVDRAAYPAGPVATGPVAALWKDRYVLRFDVAPLSDAETDALVGAVLQGQVEGRTLRQIRQATGGNPLFLRELLISARETGVLDDNGGVWRAYGKLGVTGRADLRQALDLHPGEHQS